MRDASARPGPASPSASLAWADRPSYRRPPEDSSGHGQRLDQRPHPECPRNIGWTCDSCGGSQHRWAELPGTYVYLLGVYLGDGCISTHPRGVYRLRLTLDAAYPRIVDEAARAMGTVIPSSRVGKILRPGCVEVSSYSKGWPCLLPQHGARQESGAIRDTPSRTSRLTSGRSSWIPATYWAFGGRARGERCTSRGKPTWRSWTAS